MTIQTAFYLTLSLMLASGTGASPPDGAAPAAPQQSDTVTLAEPLPVPEGRSWFNCLTSKKALQRYYPKQAQYEDVQGEATIQCRLRTNGQPSQCAWVSETPPKYGFGETAERLGCLMKFKGPAEDLATEPYLLIPIHFRLPN